MRVGVKELIRTVIDDEVSFGDLLDGLKSESSVSGLEARREGRGEETVSRVVRLSLARSSRESKRKERLLTQKILMLGLFLL